MIWSTDSVSECPGCGGTVIVGIMSLCALCDYCGFIYVDMTGARGWYLSKAAFERGDGRIA